MGRIAQRYHLLPRSFRIRTCHDPEDALNDPVTRGAGYISIRNREAGIGSPRGEIVDKHSNGCRREGLHSEKRCGFTEASVSTALRDDICPGDLIGPELRRRWPTHDQADIEIHHQVFIHWQALATAGEIAEGLLAGTCSVVSCVSRIVLCDDTQTREWSSHYKHQSYDSNTRILTTACDLLLQQENWERRRFIDSIVSQCTYADGSLCATYRKPLDAFIEGSNTKIWRG